MNDNTPPVCGDCGTPMSPFVLGEQVTEGHNLTILADYTCDNPDCPGKDSDLAKAAPQH
ncbi:MAG TPA: hypothetical protein VIL87_16740 [Dermatophilaceae bacterium]|jgi:hypothetical protein